MDDILTKNELLKYALDSGMFNIELTQEKYEMAKKREFLSKHPYKIWKGKDENWYTYLPDEKKGRVLRKRVTEDKIKEVVISYWKDQEENPTIENIYKEWLQAKLDREEISLSTRDRYNRQYDQCFKEFGSRKIKRISEYDIENFILDSIHEHKLTPRGFANLRTLVFGIFKMAKKKRLISYSITEVVKDIEISRKSFRRNIKKDDEQVFMTDELPRVMEYLENNMDLINLGIMLLFKTGLRIGELAALKSSDISGNIVHVHRTEICYKSENGERIFEVRDFPKTEAGIRDVVVPRNSLWVLRKIRSMNPFGEYLFEDNGERIRTYVFRSRLITVCKHANVKRKSPHKIRKTYGSILIDKGVEESLVINQMGHTDIKTTKEYYYKNRKNSREIQEIIDDAL